MGLFNNTRHWLKDQLTHDPLIDGKPEDKIRDLMQALPQLTPELRSEHLKVVNEYTKYYYVGHHREGVPAETVRSVNTIAREINRLALVDQARVVLEQSGGPPTRKTLEESLARSAEQREQQTAQRQAAAHQPPAFDPSLQGIIRPQGYTLDSVTVPVSSPALAPTYVSGSRPQPAGENQTITALRQEIESLRQTVSTLQQERIAPAAPSVTASLPSPATLTTTMDTQNHSTAQPHGYAAGYELARQDLAQAYSGKPQHFDALLKEYSHSFVEPARATHPEYAAGLQAGAQSFYMKEAPVASWSPERLLSDLEQVRKEFSALPVSTPSAGLAQERGQEMKAFESKLESAYQQKASAASEVSAQTSPSSLDPAIQATAARMCL